MLQAGGQQIPPQLDGLPGGQRGAQELHARFHQLVRFVEHHHIHGGQQLRHAAVAQRHVGKEEMVVDDHQIRRHGLAPRVHDVAGAVLRALGAQAVVARGGDQRDHRRTVVQTFDLRHIPAVGALRPSRHAVQRAHRKTIRQLRAVFGLVQPPAAQIAGAALEQGRAHRHAQSIAQARQVAQVQLVLQTFRGGADQRAAARQQQRHEVSKGLAHAGAGLGHQRLALVHSLGDALRHLVLHITRHEAGLMPRDGAVGREGQRHGPFKLTGHREAQAGSGGSSSLSSRAI